ncbi:hypothetical protein [Streptomyces sp. NPDC046942]|uniref:hypothetical protein n=1 Tax=Streptomyces sp. NPDC046942 TaxID=3155137 RepID=UPI0033D11502
MTDTFGPHTEGPAGDASAARRTPRRHGARGVPGGPVAAGPAGPRSAVEQRDTGEGHGADGADHPPRGSALIPRPALPASSAELSVHTLNTPVRRSIQAVYHMGMGRRPDIGGALDMPVSAAASEVPAGSRRP